MNVINKLKSKKNKEAASQIAATQDIIQQETSHKTIEAVQPKPQSKVELRSFSNVSEKSSHIENDMYENNIEEYYSRRDKKIQMINKIDSSNNIQEQDINLRVRKSFNIADISVFEGELSHRAQGKEVNCQKVKLSCSQDAIQFPQTISKILLSKVTMLSKEEGLFLGEDILKLTQKKQAKK